MKMPKFDKTLVEGLVIGIAAAAVSMAKAKHDKKVNEAKMIDAVNKVIEQKLGDK